MFVIDERMKKTVAQHFVSDYSAFIAYDCGRDESLPFLCFGEDIIADLDEGEIFRFTTIDDFCVDVNLEFVEAYRDSDYLLIFKKNQ